MVVDPPPLVPLVGPTEASLKKRAKRQARKARLQAEAEAVSHSQTQPTTSSIQQLPADTEGVVEVVAGVAMRHLSLDPDGSSSDILSERTSDEEDMLLASSSGEAVAEVGTSSLAPVEAVVVAEAGTAVGRKRKTEMGPTSP